MRNVLETFILLVAHNILSAFPVHQPDASLVCTIPIRLATALTLYHSFQNYTDYFRCIAAKGEDFAPCNQFKRVYHSICPSKSSLLLQ